MFIDSRERGRRREREMEGGAKRCETWAAFILFFIDERERERERFVVPLIIHSLVDS